MLCLKKMRSVESQKLREVCDLISDMGIDYVLVGEDVRRLTEVIDSDVDIVISKKTLKQIDHIMQVISQNVCAKLIQYLRHEAHAHYYVITWINDEIHHFLRLDFCSDYIREARQLITSEELLIDRQQDHTSGFYTPSSRKNLIYYLLKKADKGIIDQSQFNFILSLYKDCDQSFLHELCQFWPKSKVKDICNLLGSNSFNDLQSKIKDLQCILKTKYRPSLRSRIAEFNRVLFRVRYPTGVWIAIYGPDGCGKTSVIQKLELSIQPAFRRCLKYHFRLFFGRKFRQEDIVVPNPHGQKIRNPITSFLKILLYALDYIIGYLVIILPAKIRSTFIIFDRYYDDIFVDPKRYCYGGPNWLLKFIQLIIPKPDLVICLDAPASVLQERKQEVSFNESARQRELYKNLVLSMNNGHVVDASQPLDNVVHNVQSIIIDYMANRSYKRIRS